MYEHLKFSGSFTGKQNVLQLFNIHSLQIRTEDSKSFENSMVKLLPNANKQELTLKRLTKTLNKKWTQSFNKTNLIKQKFLVKEV
jgi:hypothetical protein